MLWRIHKTPLREKFHPQGALIMHGDADGNWALVLAAGEGSRLRTLTTADSGAVIPKQFCSLYEGPSLLHEALRRVRGITDSARICTVVAAQHRSFWESQLRSLCPENIVAQPQNRGTAIGILLPLLCILLRDAAARIVLLPSDHHVREEWVLAASLADAVEQLHRRADEVLLLGIEPDEPDPELGYIVPGVSDGHGASMVERFVEKPTALMAQELIRAGGLWNAFIVGASGQALLTLFRERIPEIVEAMRAAVQSDVRCAGQGSAIAELYDRLPTVDFSRDILAGQETKLRALSVPPCGWSDLGTPRRVANALQRVPRRELSPRMQAGVGCLSLAAQHARLSVERAGCSSRPAHYTVSPSCQVGLDRASA